MFLPSFNFCFSVFGTLFLSTLRHTTSAPVPVVLTKHSDGYTFPVGVVEADDGLGRLYIIEQFGTISITLRDTFGQVAPVKFLDVSNLLGNCIGFCGENGLLGLAFHPDYANNGYFYINYTRSNFFAMKTRISRFSRSTTNPDLADPNSELILMEYDQPYQNQ